MLTLLSINKGKGGYLISTSSDFPLLNFLVLTWDSYEKMELFILLISVILGCTSASYIRKIRREEFPAT